MSFNDDSDPTRPEEETPPPAGDEPTPADPGATIRMSPEELESAAPPPAAPAMPSQADPGATMRMSPEELAAQESEGAPADPGATVRMSPEQVEAATPDPESQTPADPGATVRMSAEEMEALLPDEPEPGATVRISPEELQEAARLAEEEAAAEAALKADDDPLIGTLIRDKWKVLKRLGAGSFGTVYKVQDVKGGWIEALKILGVDRLTGAEAEEMRARFLREAQIMKRLGAESAHIVGLATYEEDIEAGLVYFLMEFVEGKSLADALDEQGPFSQERTIRLAKQACDALITAHEGPEGVVHRDLKLENLMLTTDRSGAEVVKILDFGIAKIAEKEADSRLTQVGTLGTPGYAAPEQLRAEAVDGRTDLFAFGVILYALMTGRDPWLGHLAHEPTHQIYDLMEASVRGAAKPMHEHGVQISPAMVSVIMKLLRRDPENRFQSARELKEALERVEAGGGDTDSSSMRVLTTEPGVNVEIRSGREVIAEGPTPCVANAIPAGTYTIVVRDPLYNESETTMILGAGVMEDVTLVTSRRAEPAKDAAPRRKKKGGVGKWIAAVFVLLIGGGVWYAQPWGRTLDMAGLQSLADQGAVTDIWLTDGGAEGGVIVAPPSVTDAVPALADFRSPFFLPLDEGDVPEFIGDLSGRGVNVDATFEIRRIRDLAVSAQARSRYYGVAGGDVQSYANRLAELDPGSAEAASLLRKVGERMAWDADVALGEGQPARAAELVDQCLELVPEHPRCLAVAVQR